VGRETVIAMGEREKGDDLISRRVVCARFAPGIVGREEPLGHQWAGRRGGEGNIAWENLPQST